jgi:hypothetical protein
VQEQRKVDCWKPLPSNAVKTVTEITSLCGSDLQNVVLSSEFRCPINPVNNPNTQAIPRASTWHYHNDPQ